MKTVFETVSDINTEGYFAAFIRNYRCSVANADEPVHVADNKGLLSTVITMGSCSPDDEVWTLWP